ncbi:hypothetical protein CROQUDRAFT_111781 [Cronartium quercuum f. sp. fusiforme G11]|uniref:Uncharacterized protein n=1 Tax=Cronartium quercuum f. sp. fusiforme G11 TaxID=708437 RepID=A0A9P6N7C4_9BASI|nr:hypothetical protein CROQUDRAFT_111781 [Cronartium quercuum f. sp. fusiforme G11]
MSGSGWVGSGLTRQSMIEQSLSTTTTTTTTITTTTATATATATTLVRKSRLESHPSW